MFLTLTVLLHRSISVGVVISLDYWWTLKGLEEVCACVRDAWLVACRYLLLGHLVKTRAHYLSLESVDPTQILAR